MKTRPELEAEAMRLIRAVETNISLDAKEVLVRALDRIQVDGAKWAETRIQETVVSSRRPNETEAGYFHRVVDTLSGEILTALENREKI